MKKHNLYNKLNIVGATPIAQTESHTQYSWGNTNSSNRKPIEFKIQQTDHLFRKLKLPCINPKAYFDRCKYIISGKSKKHDDGRRGGLWESWALRVLLQNLEGGVWEGDHFKLNKFRSSWSAHLRTLKLFINWDGDVNPNQEYWVKVGHSSLAGGWVYSKQLVVIRPPLSQHIQYAWLLYKCRDWKPYVKLVFGITNFFLYLSKSLNRVEIWE